MMQALVLSTLLLAASIAPADALGSDWELIQVGLMMLPASSATLGAPGVSPQEQHISRLVHRSLHTRRRDYAQSVHAIERRADGQWAYPSLTTSLFSGLGGATGGLPGLGSATGGLPGLSTVAGGLPGLASLTGGLGGNGTKGLLGKRAGTKDTSVDQELNWSSVTDGGPSEFRSIITWYTGADLLQPSCLPDGGWTPTDESMIAAVTLNWFGKPPCGSFLELRARSKPKKSIVVRVMDSCAGCSPGVPHIDLTKAAFQQLYDLDVGYVEQIETRILEGPPFQRYGKNEVALYGPKSLMQSDQDEHE